MVVEGWVEFLHCEDCGTDQAQWLFSGDTDMATQGLISAGDRGGAVLVLGRDPIAVLEIDARTAKYKRSEDKTGDARGSRFPDFVNRYVPPSVIYTCPWCDAGEMAASRITSASSFQADGGLLVCQGDIEIRESSK